MRRIGCKVTREWIIPDVFAAVQECIGILNAHFRETLLPDRRAETKFPPCPEGKAAFDELDGSFDCHLAFDGEEYVEVIRHDYEFVQAEFSLGTIAVEHAHE